MNNDMNNTQMEQGSEQLQIQITQPSEQTQLEIKEITAVDMAIMQERNKEIKNVEQDVGILSELFHTIQHMVWEQGVDLNVAYENVERAEINTTEAKDSLENAAKYQTKNTRNIRDTSIVVTGLAIGGVGWIGGPWIGIPTTAVGVGISTGIVMLLRKIGV